MIQSLKEYIADPEVFYPGCEWYHDKLWNKNNVVLGIYTDNGGTLIEEGFYVDEVLFSYTDNVHHDRIIPTIDEAYAVLYYWQMVVGLEEEALETRREYAILIGRTEMLEEGFTFVHTSYPMVLDKYGREVEVQFETPVEYAWGKGLCLVSEARKNVYDNRDVLDHKEYEYDDEGRIFRTVEGRIVDGNRVLNEKTTEYSYESPGTVNVNIREIAYNTEFGNTSENTEERSFSIDPYGREQREY